MECLEVYVAIVVLTISNMTVKRTTPGQDHNLLLFHCVIYIFYLY